MREQQSVAVVAATLLVWATNSSLIASVTPLDPPGVSEANVSRQPDDTRRAVE